MYIKLIEAARVGNLAAVTRLVCDGADVTAANDVGDTALHWASSYGHAAVVEFLVSKGADVNVVNEDGDTPLYVADKFGHAAVVSILESAAQRSLPTRR